MSDHEGAICIASVRIQYCRGASQGVQNFRQNYCIILLLKIRKCFFVCRKPPLRGDKSAQGCIVQRRRLLQVCITQIDCKSPSHVQVRTTTGCCATRARHNRRSSFQLTVDVSICIFRTHVYTRKPLTNYSSIYDELRRYSSLLKYTKMEGLIVVLYRTTRQQCKYNRSNI